MKIPPRINEALLASADVDAQIEKLALNSAQALVASGEPLPSTVEDVKPGSRFRIPLVIPEGIPSGDGRTFENDSLTWRDLPIELLWQPSTGSGHDGSFIVGRIDSLERVDGELSGVGNALGVFDTGPYAREAERLVREGFLRGISADLDQFEASVETDAMLELAESSEDGGKSRSKIKNDDITVEKARVMAVTLVPKRAFQECTIELLDDDVTVTADIPIEDGMYEEAVEDPEAVLAALTASAIPVVPPHGWFENPRLSKPTPITVEDNGRVFGHIAAFNVRHIGLPHQPKPPRSPSNYAYFKTGVLRTDSGEDVAVGQLTLAGGHAPLNASAREAARHYDDTASAIADVTVGEDVHGIWVAGALRPEATPEQIRALRASAPSGDWRPIGRNLELVAICQVNVPGFPIARSMVAGGQVLALVAAGARPLAELREAKIDDIDMRLREIEEREFSRLREAAISKLSSLVDEFDSSVDERRAAVLSLVEEAEAELESLTASARASILELDDEDEED